jgi:hypothetical protein
MGTRRGSLFLLGCILGSVVVMAQTVAMAATTPVGLGTAGSFAVLAGAGVTNSGPTVVNGDLGTSPNPSITGFPPGVVNGAIHPADAVALQAKNDLTTAFNDAAGRTPFTNVAAQLGGTPPFLPGVYRSPTFQITGTLTLDAQGDPNAVFIFQTGAGGTTLNTASNSAVNLINGAQACNVFWQIGSSATLGTASFFVGNIFAAISISANTGAVIQGRLLAESGAVTLLTNQITRSQCAAGTVGGPPTGGTSGTPTPTTPGTPGTNPFGSPFGPGGPTGFSFSLPGSSLPGGGVPGLNRGPNGDEGPIPSDTPRSREQRDRDTPDTPETPETPTPAPAPAPPPAPSAPPTYGVGSSFLAPTPAAPPSRSQGPPSLAHTD